LKSKRSTAGCPPYSGSMAIQRFNGDEQLWEYPEYCINRILPGF
jgi:hypothetical protein